MATKTLAPVGFARTHIHALREEADASCHRIADAAGVTHGFVNGIVYGDGRYNRSHADAAGIKRILALTPADIPPPNHPGQRHPHPGAQRRTQALHAAGFPFAVQARAAGVGAQPVRDLARSGLAQDRTADAINRAYNTLRDTRPEDHGVGPLTVKGCLKTAAANGWHTPAWWDANGGIDATPQPAAATPKRNLPETPAKGWEKHAACRNEDPELFYPTSYTTGPGRAQVAQAKAVCFQCPVRALCLAAAINRGDDDGIYGGTTPAERNNELEAAA